MQKFDRLVRLSFVATVFELVRFRSDFFRVYESARVEESKRSAFIILKC